MARRRCPAVGRRAPGRSSTNGGEDEGEELDEAAAMSSIGGRDELNESGVEELGDEDHDREDEDKDGGEELDEAAAMTSIGGRDELNEARGRAHGMVMARSNGWIRDGVGELLEAASGCGRGSVRPGAELALICASARGRCWRWS
jgi:hypothetical protein